MVDAVTNNYDLTLPTVGADTGTWGGILNTNTFTPIDAILGTNLPVTITSADVTLTNTQFQNATFTITGTLTGNRNLIIPLSPNSTSAACGGNFVVANNSSGAFSINVKSASSNSGAGVTVPQGFAAQLYCDGSNVFYATNGLIGYAAASNGIPSGTIAGTAASANTNATLAVDYTTGLLYVCSASGAAGSATYIPAAGFLGFDTPQNLLLSASISANILTVSALANNIAATPTAASPITFRFRDSVLANGDPIQVQATSALTISTFAVGASLGSTNGKPFRFWIVVFNNGGVPVLGLINCSTSSSILPLNESGIASTTGMTAGATSAGVFYTPNGVSLTSKAFRIIGFLSYESGLATAGTYNFAPTVVQLFGPGVKKPGDTVQMAINSTTSATTIGSSNTQTSLSAAITPTSAVNPVMVKADVNWQSGTGQTEYATAQLSRGTGPTFIGNKYEAGQNANTQFSMAIASPLQAFDLPGTTSATTYYVYMSVVQGGATFNSFTFAQFMYLEELMG